MASARAQRRLTSARRLRRRFVARECALLEKSALASRVRAVVVRAVSCVRAVAERANSCVCAVEERTDSRVRAVAERADSFFRVHTAWDRGARHRVCALSPSALRRGRAPPQPSSRESSPCALYVCALRGFSVRTIASALESRAFRLCERVT